MYAKGADLSHWQTDQAFADVLRWADFVAIKSGDGGSISSDPEFASRWSVLGGNIQSGNITLRIAYQWLNGSDGIKEANTLLAAMGQTGRQARGAFDFEDKRANGYELIHACQRYHQVKGHKALVYGGAKLRAEPATIRQSVAQHADLWLADWDAPYPTIYPWPDWKFLQYHGTGLDLDEFHGDVAGLKRYLGLGGPPPWPGVYLKFRVRHWSVKKWAERLKQLKIPGSYLVTTYFGWGKVLATRRFQVLHHLPVDGVVGRRTWDAAF